MKLKLFLALIIILSLFLRVFRLDKNPATLYGDEQAFAWNAYNILKTGADEYGTPYPLQFRSFDDYKSPIPVYLLVPVFKFAGMNILSIRMPIAIASVLTVYFSFFLFKLFFNKKISLIATFLFAISPWHIHLSRGYFEATLSLLFFILAVFFFLKEKRGVKYIILSSIFFAATLYSYFTPRILLPVFIPFLIIFRFYIYKNIIYDRKVIIKSITVFLLLLFVLSLPLAKMTFFDRGFSRMNKLFSTRDIIVTDSVVRERNSSGLPLTLRSLFHNKYIVWLRLIKNDYIEHFSPNFWFIYGDNSLRYFTGNMGMFYLAELPFLVIGIYYLLKEKKAAGIFLTGWLLLAPLPSAIAGRSFAIRSMAMLPVPFAIFAYGLMKLNNVLSPKILRKLFYAITVAVFAFSLGRLLIAYYFDYPVYAATWWGWENKTALDLAKGEENNYDHIFISDFYSGAPLAYAVYNSYDPLKYRFAINNPVVMADGRNLIKMGKYYFGSLDIDTKRLNSGVIPPLSLYIGRPEEADSGENITAPDDGRVIFKIYRTR